MVPELKLEGVRFRVYRGGDLRAFGDAGTVTLRRDSTEIAAQRIEVVLPRPGADVRVAAPAGGGVMSAHRFSASGGVTVSFGAGVARTESARFEPGGVGGLVRGDDPVAVEGRGYRLTGTGFDLDAATGEISVRGRARLVAGTGGAP